MSVTIKDISSKSSVSIATVSKVLNGDYSKVSDETRDRILKVAEEMDYRPNLMARSLVRKKSTLIGLIVPDISNPYYAEMCRGIADESLRSGYISLIANTDLIPDRELNSIQTMAEYNVGGVVFIGDAMHVDENLNLLQRYRVPYMSVDNYKPGMEYCVYVDNFTGSYRAVEHLIRRGHTQIAYISGCSPSYENARILGFRSAMHDNKLPIDTYLVEYGSYTLESGYRNTLHLLNRGIPFTAIACDNDLIALGAFKAIREQRLRVPQDISLVGFDDVYLSNVIEPRMTTVRQPAYEIGACAMQMLLNRIEKRPMESTVRCFSPMLIERDTVSFRT